MKTEETKKKIEAQSPPTFSKPTAIREPSVGRAPAKLDDPPELPHSFSSARFFADTGGTHLTALDDW
jgi:hypothetical protein